MTVVERLMAAKKRLDEETIVRLLSISGFSCDEAIPLADGEEAFDGTEYWTYRGPLDEKTRPFCASLLKIDRYWTTEDFDLISRKIGYNCFEYVGGFNCRHYWQKARIKGRVKKGYSPKTPTPGQVDRSAVRNPSSNQDYFPL